jgi:uroporphyrin-III C-methyltransferase
LRNVRGRGARRGSLTVVGTGIDVTTQLTPGARAAIEGSDEVLYLVADSVSALRIVNLNPRAHSLDEFYGPDKNRQQTYAEIVETIVASAVAGADVCAVFYGHPGVFAYPGHEALARVREAGLPARMLPAVSALDCLVADLGIDPGRTGLQSYEATYFLLHRPAIDPHAMLLLWQVGMIGEVGGAATSAVKARFQLLVEQLRDRYGEAREALLYEASPYPGPPPAAARFRLGDFELPAPSPVSTLCIPADRVPPVDVNARALLALTER